MKKKYRINFIWSNRSYSVKEASTLLDVHIRTVQSWIKSGLRVLEGSRPFLIMGQELKQFAPEVQALHARLEPVKTTQP